MKINGIDLNQIDPDILQQAKNIMIENGINSEKIDKAVDSVENNKMLQKKVEKYINKNLKENNK